jgi:hypothetical protein
LEGDSITFAFLAVDGMFIDTEDFEEDGWMRWILSAVALALVVPILAGNLARQRKSWWL